MKDILDTEAFRINRTFNEDYFFGAVYTDYDKFYEWEKYATDLTNRYTFNSFLDVGCGCGNLVKEIKAIINRRSRTDHDIQGIDASDFAVSRANVPFVQLADCRDLPFADKQFDLVYILTTFSYLPFLADIKLAMQEAYRVSSRTIVFDDVYSAPSQDSYEYDPRREIIYSQDQWLSHWQKILGPNDSAEIRDYEIVINKDGS